MIYDLVTFQNQTPVTVLLRKTNMYIIAVFLLTTFIYTVHSGHSNIGRQMKARGIHQVVYLMT